MEMEKVMTIEIQMLAISSVVTDTTQIFKAKTHKTHSYLYILI